MGLTLEHNYIVINTKDIGEDTMFLAFDGYAGWTKNYKDATLYQNPPHLKEGEYAISVYDFVKQCEVLAYYK